MNTESRPPRSLVKIGAWAVGIATTLLVCGVIAVPDWRAVVLQVLAGLFGSAT